MATITNTDGLEIVVLLTDEISSAITNWAGVAELYECKTELTLEILGQYFLTRNQFLSYDAEIKYYISNGLNEKDRLILNESAEFLNERNKSPEKKLLADSRNLIKKKILKIFNRLLQELFPSFLPPKIDTVKQRTKAQKENPDDDTIPYSTNETEPLLDVEDEEPNDEELLSNLNMRNLSINETIPEVNQKITTSSPCQDLFETPMNILMLLDEVLNTMKGKVIFEPCCGNGSIVKYLVEKGFEVIGEVKYDYITEIEPEYDVLITNPPLEMNHQYFEKAMNSGKPFIMLLPLHFLTSKYTYENSKRCEINIMIINGDVGRDIGWFFVNMNNGGGGHFTVRKLPELLL